MGFPFKKGKRNAQAAAVEGKPIYSKGKGKKVASAGPEAPPFMKKGG